jgi:hypothetical protein
MSAYKDRLKSMVSQAAHKLPAQALRTVHILARLPTRSVSRPQLLNV